MFGYWISAERKVAIVTFSINSSFKIELEADTLLVATRETPAKGFEAIILVFSTFS